MGVKHEAKRERIRSIIRSDRARWEKASIYRLREAAEPDYRISHYLAAAVWEEEYGRTRGKYRRSSAGAIPEEVGDMLRQLAAIIAEAQKGKAIKRRLQEAESILQEIFRYEAA